MGISPTGRAGYPKPRWKGVDRGVAIPFALSTGETVHLPETAARLERSLHRAQKTLSHHKWGAWRYARARSRLAHLKGNLVRIRSHAAHAFSRWLVNWFGLIAIEDLRTRAMTRSARGTVTARNILARALNPDRYQRGSTPSLDAGASTSAACEAPTRFRSQGLDAQVV